MRLYPNPLSIENAIYPERTEVEEIQEYVDKIEDKVSIMNNRIEDIENVTERIDKIVTWMAKKQNPEFNINRI